ncbi:hypothetical protein A2V49_04335 [candidate division WWE3 bacterium RBG_19FT_COMBO_34_6]|uniref:Uncharacterized protein n=1 Tax=candidate division WWE3 bacterium RBG_19FT_COMBO_34_6 TaxID=1802612 RepID=A0A1F4UKI7_UNCKA|nr:MAG: hypothetical protein A2V49_04335 [candidate division WWE3 bacterium RBG_19FT_COMBO_34_6]
MTWEVIECLKNEFPKECYNDSREIKHCFFVEFNFEFRMFFNNFEEAFYVWKYGRKEKSFINSHFIGNCAIDTNSKKTAYIDYTPLFLDRNKSFEDNLKILKG